MYEFLLKIACICIIIPNVHSDINYRLNTPIKPSAYAIAITPYFDTEDEKAFTFDGEVSITFVPETNINRIKLHSEDLKFTSADITLTKGGSPINLKAESALQFEQNYTFAHIFLENEIPAQTEYVLKIVYKGPIRTDLKGFYRNYYIEKGVKKWLGATQMEPTHARKVFPCFDEPELKAVFTLTIDRPANYKSSLANTKLQDTIPLPNGYVREVFYPTPKMSTYLVAFLVSEFEAGSIRTGTKELGIYSRPEARNQTQYAFEFGVRVVEELGNYFGIDYYSTNTHLKLDHIALLDFNAGAMENWGLVTYREALLLYVPEDSTPSYKYRVAQIVAHETTHMWFGNLVTCHWWSNTWLNEGFANYFQDYITSLIEPEVGSADVLVIGSVYAAYDADDDPDSPPISNDKVNSPAQISEHFGTITYQKAGSVIRMMHHLIGDAAFKFGLNSYLSTNQFEAGYPEKLYTGLSRGVANFNSLDEYPGSDITTIMSSWIVQSGHPVLNVEVNYRESLIVLTQKRFYIDPSHKSDEIYQIPITYTTEKSPNFNNTKPVFIMKNQSLTLHLDESYKRNHYWILFNVQETGLYRVNYDIDSWQIISEVLNSDEREEFHYINRAKIINDLFAFVYADEVKFEVLKDVLGFLKEEEEYAVWYSAIRGFNQLRHYYKGTDTLKLIDDFALELMENIITKLGYEVRSTDDLTTQKNRMQLLGLACKIGHQGCIDHTLEHFRKLKNSGEEIQPSLRPVSYCTGLRFGNGSDYDFLWDRMTKTNVANEARTIMEVLGCTTVEEKLKSYLSSMLVENSPIRTQDLTAPLTSVLANYSNVHIVLEVLQENITHWNAVYSSLDSVLSSVASSLHTEEDFTNFEKWLTSCSDCSAQAITGAKTALNKAKKAKKWADNHESDIVSALRNNSNNLSSSLLLLVLMFVCAVFSSL